MYKTDNPTPGGRRGVTLLIVLAMMTMFAMLVTSFMVIVSHNRRTAELQARFLTNDPPAWGQGTTQGTVVMQRGTDLEDAFQYLLRGGGKIGDNSILQDLYGASGEDMASFIQSVTSGEDDYTGFLAVEIEDLANRLNHLGNVVTIAFSDEYKDSSSNAGLLHHQSTFVYDVDIETETVWLAPFRVDLGISQQVHVLGEMSEECRLIFNAPRRSGSSPTSLEHSLFLAWNGFEGDEDDSYQRIVPSFHRLDWGEEDILRPFPFTGNNPAAAEDNWDNFIENGPWDVDNDGNGVADGVWIDAGLLPRQDAGGRWYKPLVSYYVVDMDGRLNINAVGNLELDSPPGGSGNRAGTGLGPAELYSSLVNRELLYGNDTWHGRYGADGEPGDEHFDETPYIEGGLQADWFGTETIEFDELGNRMVEVPESANPYWMDPYSGAADDEPFGTNDLELLIRSIIDSDYTAMNTSVSRLRELLDEGLIPDSPQFVSTAKRFNLGTRSSSIPAAPPLYSTVRSRVETDEDAYKLWQLLPLEVRRGEKVDLNRLTRHPDWMEGGDDVLKEKVKFAQEIFYLLQVVAPPENQAGLERYAQWSVNLIDFIDPDDVMTPFIFSKEFTQGNITVFDMFDNDGVDLIHELLSGSLSGTALSGVELIWGFEKPEVVITETLALHNRHVIDEDGGSNANIYDPPRDFKQVERPQGSLFVELYRLGNEHRSYVNNSVVDTNGNLNLAKRTENGEGYVWRLAIGEATQTEEGKYDWREGNDKEKSALEQLFSTTDAARNYPQFYQWYYDNPQTEGGGEYRHNVGLGVPEQFIWFGSTAPTTNHDTIRRSFWNPNNNNVTLANDSVLVVAPRLETALIRRLTGPGTTHHAGINLNAANTMLAVNPNLLISPTGQGGGNNVPWGLNVSEPLPVGTGPTTLVDGYAPAWPPTSGNVSARDPLDSGILRQRGTVPGYKTIALQRLADPNRVPNAISNPYITVDWSMIDLHVFNNYPMNNPSARHLEEEPDANAAPPGWESHSVPREQPGMRYFASRQWNHTRSGTSDEGGNIWNRTLTPDELNSEKAGLEEHRYEDDPHPNTFNNSNSPPASFDSSRYEPVHTLGTRNHSTPFLHFPWHDTPLMNTGELMLVPASAPGRFGLEFHDRGTGNFFGDSPRYSPPDNIAGPGPYLDWNNEKMREFFKYVHVPSRFAGTRWGSDPDDPLDNSIVYREPGKLNINTVSDEGAKALDGGRGLIDYDELADARSWADVRSWTEQTWLKHRLDHFVDNDEENPYLILYDAMRLSDLATMQSNVFAIWITVGYFESDAAGEIAPDARERGWDDGSLRRYRAFYLIDRSIPVGFRHGESLNSQNVILRHTLLE